MKAARAGQARVAVQFATAFANGVFLDELALMQSTARIISTPVVTAAEGIETAWAITFSGDTSFATNSNNQQALIMPNCTTWWAANGVRPAGVIAAALAASQSGFNRFELQGGSQQGGGASQLRPRTLPLTDVPGAAVDMAPPSDATDAETFSPVDSAAAGDSAGTTTSNVPASDAPASNSGGGGGGSNTALIVPLTVVACLGALLLTCTCATSTLPLWCLLTMNERAALVVGLVGYALYLRSRRSAPPPDSKAQSASPPFSHRVFLAGSNHRGSRSRSRTHRHAHYDDSVSPRHSRTPQHSQSRGRSPSGYMPSHYPAQRMTAGAAATAVAGAAPVVREAARHVDAGVPQSWVAKQRASARRSSGGIELRASTERRGVSSAPARSNQVSTEQPVCFCFRHPFSPRHMYHCFARVC